MDETNNLPVPEMNNQNVPIAPKKSNLIGVIIALVVLVAAGAFGYYWNSRRDTGTAQPLEENINSNNNPAGNSNSNAGQPTSAEPLVSGLIAWHYPQQSYAAELFKKVEPGADNVSYFDPVTEAKYSLLGTFKSGKYSDHELLLVKAVCEGPCSPYSFFFAKKNQSYTLLEKYSDNVKEYSYLDETKFGVDKEYVIKDYDFPSTLTGPGKNKALKRAEKIPFTSTYEDFNSTGLKFVYNDPKVGAVYTTPDNKDAVAGIYQQYGFYVKAPDYRLLVYQIDRPNFVDAKNIAQVTWNDGKANTSAYAWVERYGCGTNFAGVTPGLDIARDLTPAGRTNKGETVYEPKDKTNKLYKDLYDFLYFPEGKKPTLAEFTAKHPIFFWVDPFNRLIKLTNNDYGPLAECGKPVIYLYPEKSADVSVKLNPQGGFSYTEPVYGEGWNVIATPEGKITNKADGKTYPYLFWEGRGGYYRMPDKGFVVSQKELHAFLVNKLAQLGLNGQETADFTEFWEPKMQGSPYYFVTFMGNQVMDEIAPLNVNPAPETVIRVLMDYAPLQQPIKVEGYNIKTPERKGFTVVEWGGVLK